MADRKFFLPFDNSMLPILLKGDTGNEGRKEFSRRDTACRKRRLKVQRFWLPKLSQPSSRLRGLALGQHPNTVKKDIVTNSQTAYRKAFASGTDGSRNGSPAGNTNMLPDALPERPMTRSG